MFKTKYEEQPDLNEQEQEIVKAFYCPNCGSKERTVKTKNDEVKLYKFKEKSFTSLVVCENCGTKFKNDSTYQTLRGALGTGV